MLKRALLGLLVALCVQAAYAAEPFGLDPSGVNVYTARWQTALRKITDDRWFIRRCQDDDVCIPAVKRFLAIVRESANRIERAQIGHVNRAANLAVLYASDFVQYFPLPDFWASPLATLGSAKGDCEDYAIVKYLAFVELGIPESNLRLVVGQMSGAPPLDHHVVLAIREKGEWLILTNNRQVHRLFTEEEYQKNFTPLYVLSAKHGTSVLQPLASR